MPAAADLELEAYLSRFKLSAFRPGQREVIAAVVAGEDCLCVMPTGGGKSLCYQLPAVAREGLTLVVSPLISLMKDQVDQLERLGLRATFINSTLELAEQSARIERMKAGQYDLVYCAAERFRSSRFIEAVQVSQLQLLAIDEAHCISEWGHDFRPDYTKLGRARIRLGNPPTIALTATATDTVRRDIVEQLALRHPRVFVTGFARPNLHLEVQTPATNPQKDETLLEFLKRNDGSGIIYCSSRKRCEEVAELVASKTKRTVGIYHAGLANDERRLTQERFMADKLQIVTATNAFGMGIDKPDVRFVVHYNLPGTLEAYYQEAGRAGRDGLPSNCLLLFSYGDRMIQEFFIESAFPSRELVAEVYNYLRQLDLDPIEQTQQEIKETLGLQELSIAGVGACERMLEKAGVLERLEPRQNMAMVKLDSDLPTLVDLLPRQAVAQRRVLRAIEQIVGPRRSEMVYLNPRQLAETVEMDQAALGRALRELKELQAFDYVPPFRGRAIHMLQRQTPFHQLNLDFETLERRKAGEYEKLERVITYARTQHCRQLEILRYFGQPDAQACGNCDNCVAAPIPVGQEPVALPNSDMLVETVRKVLSGVARARGRFGKQLIAQMLCGASTAKIRKFNLERLSTYGLLADLGQEEVCSLIDALVLVACLEQIEVDRFKPIVQLTQRGAEVMRGQSPLPQLPLPKKLAARFTPAPPNKTKSKARNTPARNETPAECPAAEIAATTQPAQALSIGDEVHPSYYWTWRLLSSGFTPAECGAARGLDEEVVLDHALRACEAGHPVHAGWFLPAELLATFEATIGAADPDRIRPLLTRLPHGTRYEQVQLFLKARRQSKSSGN